VCYYVGDLKSKNVLLSRNCGVAKLSDVGMSRVLASTFMTGDMQAPTGTFAYAVSPPPLPPPPTHTLRGVPPGASSPSNGISIIANLMRKATGFSK